MNMVAVSDETVRLVSARLADELFGIGDDEWSAGVRDEVTRAVVVVLADVVRGQS